MIFVTVGTHRQGFNRLLEEVDRLVGNKKIKERIFVEIGNSNYAPKNCKYTRFLPHKKYEKMMASADIIITHGGLGSVIDGLKNKKRLIVVPRLKRFYEHVDDHQLQLARVLEKKRNAIVLYEIKNLFKALQKAKKFKVGKKKEKSKIIDIIQSFLNSIKMS